MKRLYTIPLHVVDVIFSAKFEKSVKSFNKKRWSSTGEDAICLNCGIDNRSELIPTENIRTPMSFSRSAGSSTGEKLSPSVSSIKSFIASKKFRHNYKYVYILQFIINYNQVGIL
jgi:hypothetical protein